MNIYLYIFLLFSIASIIVTVFRMTVRALFFKRQIGIPAMKGLIPVYSNQLLYKTINERKTNLVGIILRCTGFFILMLVIILQAHATQVALTHIYGLILGFYEVPDYSTLWNVMTVIGGILLVIGILIRLVMTKRMTKYFGIRHLGIYFMGMLFPGCFELYLAFSRKHKFLLNKNPKEMTRDEYLLYTMIKEE